MHTYTFGFIGLGLIGGSIAKALRRVMPSCRIIAYNRSEQPRIMALRDGTADVVSFLNVITSFFVLPLKRMLNILRH